MTFFRLGILTLALAAIPSPATEDAPTFCKVWSPEAAPPPELSRLYDQMPYLEVIEILGEPDYSPIDGQYYYSTDGDCSLLQSGGRIAPCGFVLEYRDFDRKVEMKPIQPGGRVFYKAYLPERQEDWRLQGCSWGGIGE